MSFDIPNFVMQALDTFNTAIVSPVYYVMFTTLTIIASAIMFKVCCSILLSLFLNLPNVFISFSKQLQIYRGSHFFGSIIHGGSHIYLYMLQDWSGQNVSSIASELCGFITVLSGTIILHVTREQEPAPTQGNKGLIFVSTCTIWCHYKYVFLDMHWANHSRGCSFL